MLKEAIKLAIKEYNATHKYLGKDLAKLHKEIDLKTKETYILQYRLNNTKTPEELEQRVGEIKE